MCLFFNPAADLHSDQSHLFLFPILTGEKATEVQSRLLLFLVSSHVLLGKLGKLFGGLNVYEFFSALQK